MNPFKSIFAAADYVAEQFRAFGDSVRQANSSFRERAGLDEPAAQGELPAERNGRKQERIGAK